MAKMKIIVIVNGVEPVNTVALDSDYYLEWLANYNGETVIPDPNDDFKTNFLTLNNCIAVDVTDLNPMPGIGTGWKYIDKKWVASPSLEDMETDNIDL